ncbi:hypothetical protein A3Q56_03084 [Intoshia linei]|uniref:Uncharacterized protein n=1 Tax=Intoshia linei TaxID=1819745 RepID=A0A177B4C2_9BILA|nr:hypothetical protein A3Q56_03084 [Intoshia linei]
MGITDVIIEYLYNFRSYISKYQFSIGFLTISTILCKLIALKLKRRDNAVNRLYYSNVLITGASSGLGRELAKTMYRLKCNLILTSRKEDKLITLRDQLKSEYPEIDTEIRLMELDLEYEESINQFLSKLKNTQIDVDILINNAGVRVRSDTQSVSLELEKKIMQINYFGPRQLTLGFLKLIQNSYMKRFIVMINSIQGISAVPYRGPYCASKHARLFLFFNFLSVYFNSFLVRAFTDVLRAEMHCTHSHINIQSIYPGNISMPESYPQYAFNGCGDLIEVNNSKKRAIAVDQVARRIFESIVQQQHECIIAPLTVRLFCYFRNIFNDMMINFQRKEALK